LAFEHFKTQVLLLHSEQSTLDDFSAGFNEKYSVHCATSGTEALNTLGDTPIHIIVSAQDLPGMSGLDALREARKRSPDTIGILLADRDEDDGLEALVSDQEVFEIVRGAITAEALLKLVESATQRMRLMALAESANDQTANPDEPVTEHIVMETSEHGSAIISDGTARLPALQPHKIQIAPDLGSRNVDVLVMTKDEEFLATIKDSARGLHNLHHAVTPTQAENYVRDNTVGVLVTDAAMVGTTIETMAQKLRKERPRMVVIVAGRRDDGEMLMDLINRGHVYRFLLKPVSPGRGRLAIEASVKHHLEAPDSAFKPKPPSARPAAKPKTKTKLKLKPKPIAKPKSVAKPKPIAKPKPVAKSKPIVKPKPVAKSKPIVKPKPVAKSKPIVKPKPVAKSKPIAKPKSATKEKPKLAPLPEPIPVLMPDPMPKAKAQPKPKPASQPTAKMKEKVADRIEPKISASAIDDVLNEVFEDKSSITETVTGIAESLGETLPRAGSLVGSAQDAARASSKAVAGAVGDALLPLRNPKKLRIAGGSIAVMAIVAWVASSWDSTPADIATEQPNVAPTVADSGSAFTPRARETLVEPEPEPIPEIPAYQALLDDARAARDAGNLIEPAGDNAVALYLVVLEEAPGDPIIGAEFDAVVGQVLGMAENAILERSAGDADSALASVRLADPDNPRLTFLDAQLTQLKLRTTVDEARLAIRDGGFEDAGRLISEARSLAGTESVEVNLLSQELSAARNQQQVEIMLVTANERLEAGDLISPSEDNARYYFVLALTNNPDNQAAQQGLTFVASKLALRAREAIDNERFDDARALLREAETLDPANSELAASSNALDTALAAKAEAERQAAAAAEAARLAELERQAELARQAEVARLAELERQAELARQAEAARQEELRRQAELERQAEIERLAELDRQAEAARLAEIERNAEAERQAKAREARQQAAEKNAAAAATASALGVAGSTIKEEEAISNSTPAFNAPRESNNDAPPRIETPLPTPAPQSTAGAVSGAMPYAVGDSTNSITLRTGTNRAAVSASPPQSFSTGNAVIDSLGSGNSNDAAGDNKVPISALTRTNYVAPVYPRGAQRRNVTGAVDIMFTVSTIGTVTDISVLSAEPEETFNQAAMDAVAEWRFEPVIENGVAVEKRSAVRLAFDLQ